MVDRGSLSSKSMEALKFVDQRVLSYLPRSKETFLADDFVPDNWSVICGKGRDCFNHIGNRRFRILCDLSLNSFLNAKTKTDKSAVVMSVVDAIRVGSPYGGFVKKDRKTGRWYEVGDAVAREKVGCHLRGLLTGLCPIRLAARKEQRKMKCRRKPHVEPPFVSSNPLIGASTPAGDDDPFSRMGSTFPRRVSATSDDLSDQASTSISTNWTSQRSHTDDDTPPSPTLLVSIPSDQLNTSYHEMPQQMSSLVPIPSGQISTLRTVTLQEPAPRSPRWKQDKPVVVASSFTIGNCKDDERQELTEIEEELPYLLLSLRRPAYANGAR